ncbi:hypothetical protein H633G_10795 [Metarhizium anisopliae BRIP 53284]|nr:hypothetical protein H633G_10795 [Metarhizium anisopliae BRIP 53284]
MKYSLAIAAAFGAGYSFALVGNIWSFSGSPPGGLTDVTFPFNIAGACHDLGYYFAQQFNFHDVPDVGYCGIQNRPNDSDGNSIIHAVFSSFQAGTTTNDSNCHDGADGGSGVSCSVDFIGDYSTTYDIVVKNMRGATWSATAVNNATGEETHIGTYTLPYGAGGITSSQLGFVEYYLWNSGAHQCSQLPKVGVTMYSPRSSTPGAGSSSMGEPYEYGDCVSQVDYYVSEVLDGWKIDVGFGQTCSAVPANATTSSSSMASTTLSVALANSTVTASEQKMTIDAKTTIMTTSHVKHATTWKDSATVRGATATSCLEFASSITSTIDVPDTTHISMTSSSAKWSNLAITSSPVEMTTSTVHTTVTLSRFETQC